MQLFPLGRVNGDTQEFHPTFSAESTEETPMSFIQHSRPSRWRRHPRVSSNIPHPVEEGAATRLIIPRAIGLKGQHGTTTTTTPIFIIIIFASKGSIWQAHIVLVLDIKSCLNPTN